MIHWRPSTQARELSCRDVGRVLQSYLDGETPEVTTRLVQLHLRACRRCGMEASTYRSMMRAFSAHHRLDLDPQTLARLRGFAESLMQDGPSAPVGEPR